MEKTPLLTQFAAKIKAATGIDFQRLVSSIMQYKYGAGFTATRESGDLGSDGMISQENKVIACYAPAAFSATKFDKKLKDDYKQYCDNWRRQYPNWQMIVNHEVNLTELSAVKNLVGDSGDIKGASYLLHIIENDLTSGQKRVLAKNLNIDPDFLASDYIKELLEDLLGSSSATLVDTIKYQSPTYIGEKIGLNYSKEDIELATDDYSLALMDFNKIKQLFSCYDAQSINSIKTRLRNDFEQTPGDFKQKLAGLANLYHQKISNIDDDCLKYAKSPILYCFEQCFLGKKTKEEQNATAAS